MKFCIFLLFVTLSIGVNAQLAKTSWKGTFLVPEPVECSFTFHADTAFLSVTSTGEVMETMKYRLSGDTLFLSKLYGISPCYDDKEAVYLCKVEKKKLLITVLDDYCYMRAGAFPVSGLELIEP